MRMTDAPAIPMRRARTLSCPCNFPDNNETNTRLSMPRTISMTVSVRNDVIMARSNITLFLVGIYVKSTAKYAQTQVNRYTRTAVQGRQPPLDRSLAPAFRHRRSFQRVRSVDQIRAPRSARLHSPVAFDPTRDYSKLFGRPSGNSGRPARAAPKVKKNRTFLRFFPSGNPLLAWSQKK